eukprot:GHVL01035475.1.p1 GENE.GHVL01035475.1~~GHVL01035475.1.p1  ORF type:complete len:409 (-),score=94.81 GHVL01035475.1:213-1325(-)
MIEDEFIIKLIDSLYENTELIEELKKCLSKNDENLEKNINTIKMLTNICPNCGTLSDLREAIIKKDNKFLFSVIENTTNNNYAELFEQMCALIVSDFDFIPYSEIYTLFIKKIVKSGEYDIFVRYIIDRWTECENCLVIAKSILDISKFVVLSAKSLSDQSLKNSSQLIKDIEIFCETHKIQSSENSEEIKNVKRLISLCLAIEEAHRTILTVSKTDVVNFLKTPREVYECDEFEIVRLVIRNCKAPTSLKVIHSLRQISRLVNCPDSYCVALLALAQYENGFINESQKSTIRLCKSIMSAYERNSNINMSDKSPNAIAVLVTCLLPSLTRDVVTPKCFQNIFASSLLPNVCTEEVLFSFLEDTSICSLK